MISIDEFKRLELLIGEVRDAAPIPGSDRLLRLTVDVGTGMRTLVAGLGASYAPDALVGLQVVVVSNLEPARIRGVESQGMLLGVGCSDTREIGLLTVNRPVVNGSRVM